MKLHPLHPEAYSTVLGYMHIDIEYINNDLTGQESQAIAVKP